MTTERFNELLKGPLYHPMAMFTISRLAIALKDVVEQTGEAGDKALEEHCRGRQEQDERYADRDSQFASAPAGEDLTSAAESKSAIERGKICGRKSDSPKEGDDAGGREL